MQQTFSEASIIRDIVTQFPKASDLFKSYRIDFCCGGNRPLVEAIQERGLSSEEVVNQLNTLYQDSKALQETNIDWNSSSSQELIDHIVHKHHKYLNEELPQLSPYVTKVFRVHGQSQPHLGTIHILFNELKKELEQHLIQEEIEDFPLLLEYEQIPTIENREKLMRVVESLEEEHARAGNLLKEIRQVTNDFTPPHDACGTYRLVYQRLEALEQDLFEHIHLENNILFPRAVS